MDFKKSSNYGRRNRGRPRYFGREGWSFSSRNPFFFDMALHRDRQGRVWCQIGRYTWVQICGSFARAARRWAETPTRRAELQEEM